VSSSDERGAQLQRDIRPLAETAPRTGFCRQIRPHVHAAGLFASGHPRSTSRTPLKSPKHKSRNPRRDDGCDRERGLPPAREGSNARRPRRTGGLRLKQQCQVAAARGRFNSEAATSTAAAPAAPFTRKGTAA
jgi:hypothetical protein